MRILLIEDDKNMAATIKEELQNYYVVELASTGKKGEYKAQINDYDLIIIDYVLPDTNGVVICEKLRKSGLTMPILMLTGQYELEKKVAALDGGADDYVTKPFQFEELL